MARQSGEIGQRPVVEFPQRQEPASFNREQVMEKLKATIGD